MTEGTVKSVADSTSAVPARMDDYTGILPSQKIQEMVSIGEIKAMLTPINSDQVQPASIDLRLGDYAYPVDTSFLPGNGVKVFEKLRQLDDQFADFKVDIRHGAVLEKGRVYVIRLLEAIDLKSEVAAFAN